MKMQQPIFEAYEFDANDVIMTSGGGNIIPAGVQFIILSDDSVRNFNEMHVAGDPTLKTLYFNNKGKSVDIYKDSFAYNRYGGDDDSYDEEDGAFYVTDAGNNENNYAVTTVRAGVKGDYLDVLSWLKTYTEYPY